MKKIKEFNTTSLDQLTSDLDVALARIAKKYGIKLQTGGIRYSANEANIKLRAQIMVTGGGKSNAVSLPKSALNAFGFYGYDIKRIRKNPNISFAGKKFQIVDFKPRSKKYPVIAIRKSDSRIYKLPIAAIQKFKK